MNKPLMLALAGICCLHGERAYAFSPEEAHRLYDERYKSAAPSVQVCGEYLFVISEGALTDQRRGDASVDILSAQLAALERYVGFGAFGYVSPFGKKMTERLGSRKIDFSIPQCRTVTVEESVGDKTFRGVSAYELAPIKAERERVLRKEPIRRSVEAWAAAIRDLTGRCQTVEARRRVMADIGCVVPLLFGNGKGCPGPEVRVDGRKVEALLGRGDTFENSSKETCLKALRTLPCYSLAHRRLAVLAFEDGDLLACLDECCQAALAGAADEELVSRAAEGLTERTGCGAWRDLAQLRQMTLKAGMPASWGDSPVRAGAWRTTGRLVAVESRDEEAQAWFGEARSMYRRGLDLPKVIVLLERAIDRNPGNSECWRYYGDALRTDRRCLEAAVAYQESLTLGNEDLGMILDLARVYVNLGLRHMSGSAGWWVLMQDECGNCRNKVVSFMKELMPDVFL